MFSPLPADAVPLRVDWSTVEAARFACARWHYSHSMPVAPFVCLGAWEFGRFVGAVIFSRGASPNMLRRYDLVQGEGCELTRVALQAHRAPVSQIVAVAVRMLRKQCPGLRLVVSFADPKQGHVGAIYQAGSWLYLGTTAEKVDYIAADGRRFLNRQVSKTGFIREFGRVKAAPKPENLTAVAMPPKHRYVLPLDAAMRAQLAPQALPYPKKGSTMATDISPVRAKEQDAEHPSALGGAAPTRALHPSPEVSL